MQTDFSLDSIQFDSAEAPPPALDMLALASAPLTIQRQEDEGEGEGGVAQPPPVFSHEEQRLEDHHAEIEDLLDVAPFEQFVSDFERALGAVMELPALQTLLVEQGQRLWELATARAQDGPAQPDDRPLYWARLQATNLLRNWAGVALSDAHRQSLITAFERASRGMGGGIVFDEGTAKKILVSGFDPFGLDGNIRNSNPSGAMALAFDGQVIGGAEVESVIFPVRYGDFDAGIVESVFQPYIDHVAMIVTISQGGDHFEAEEYTGRRRSVGTGFLDNAGDWGGTETAPVIPPGLEQGPEFQRSTLPFMFNANGRVAIADNLDLFRDNQVNYIPAGAAAPMGQTDAPPPEQYNVAGGTDDSTLRAVKGSGGGFLSNEVSYRANYVRNTAGVSIPVWHLHTPALSDVEDNDDARRTELISQARAILEQAVANLDAAGSAPRD